MNNGYLSSVQRSRHGLGTAETPPPNRSAANGRPRTVAAVDVDEENPSATARLERIEDTTAADWDQGKRPR